MSLPMTDNPLTLTSSEQDGSHRKVEYATIWVLPFINRAGHTKTSLHREAAETLVAHFPSTIGLPQPVASSSGFVDAYLVIFGYEDGSTATVSLSESLTVWKDEHSAGEIQGDIKATLIEFGVPLHSTGE